MAAPNEPFSREEGYYDAILGNSGSMPDYPMSRKERYLEAIALNGGGGGGVSTVPIAYELLRGLEEMDYDEEMSAADVVSALGGDAAATSFFQAIRNGATPKCDITIDGYRIIMNTMVSAMTPDSIQIFIPGVQAIMAFNMSGDTTTDGMVKNSLYPIE